MANYTVYHGTFLCQECKAEVSTLRLYPSTYEMTWMCKDKHLSRVLVKKKKKDYEREE
jgi:uncharacterized protein YlaI